VEVLVCVKRVPMVGGTIVVTADGQDVDTKMSGFAMSPHEECAVEEAIRLTERLGGGVSVLTLGPPDATEQLREALALGAGRAVLLATDGREWGPIATAGAIVAEARRRADAGQGYDLLLLGNEAADTGDYQVGVRAAHALGWPVVTGIKGIETDGSTVRARQRAKRAEIEQHEPQWQPEGLRKQGLRVPGAERKRATVLGTGPDAVPALVGVLAELGVLP